MGIHTSTQVISVAHSVNRGGLVLWARSVLIVDWDVHHGQATQYAFYDEPRVLYFSIHRYMHSEFWPSLRQSDYDFVGAPGARGFNINVPLNKVHLLASMIGSECTLF